MADHLVRVRIGDRIKNVGSAFAKKHSLEVVDESPRRPDGTLRPEMRSNGRRVKPKTTVAGAAAAKKKDQATPDPAEPNQAEEATE